MILENIKRGIRFNNKTQHDNSIHFNQINNKIIVSKEKRKNGTKNRLSHLDADIVGNRAIGECEAEVTN